LAVTEQQKSSIGYNLIAIVLTAIVTGAITWGANAQRITYLEREISEIRPVLLRIDRTLSNIERGTQDYDRRLNRLEMLRP